MKKFLLLITLSFSFAYSGFSTDTGGTIGTSQTIFYNAVPVNIKILSYAVCGSNQTRMITIKWQKNEGAGWVDIPGSACDAYGRLASTNYTTYFTVTDHLIVTTSYRTAVTLSGYTSLLSNEIIVTVLPQPLGGTIGTDQTICYNTTPSPLTSVTPPTGGGSYTIAWYWTSDVVVIPTTTWHLISGATGLSYTPTYPSTDLMHYKRVATFDNGSGAPESNTVTISVYPQISAGSISGTQTICYNSKPSGFSNVTLPSGGSGSYSFTWRMKAAGSSSWYDISNSNAATYIEQNNLTANTNYLRVANFGSCGTIESNTIVVTTRSPLLPGAISGNQQICYNSLPSQFTSLSLASGGSNSFSYQWYKRVYGTSNWTMIPSSNGSTYQETQPLFQSTEYERVVTDASCGSVESNTILVQILPTVSGGSIAGTQTVCYNTAPAPLTSVTDGSWGGNTVNYQWYKSENSGVSWSLLPGATIASYISVPLTTTAQFKRVSTAASCGSAESNVITVTVYPQQVAGSISSDQTISYNSTPAPFTNVALPTGSTGSFTYQWRKSVSGGQFADIPGATYSTYSETSLLTLNTNYKRVEFSGNCTSTESNTVAVTVLGALSPGSIATSQQICSNSVPARFTNIISPSGATGTYTFQWRKRVYGQTQWVDIPNTNSSEYQETQTLSQPMEYERVVSSGAYTPVESNIVLVQIFPTVSGGAISGTQTVCYNGAPAPLTSVTDGSWGGNTVNYQWYKSENSGVSWLLLSSATNASYISEPLTTTTQFKRVSTAASCGSAESNVITVTVYPQQVAGIIGSDQTISFNSTPAPFTNIALPTGSTGSFTFQWKKSIGGAQFVDIPGATYSTYSETSNLTLNTSYKRVEFSGSCGNTESNTIVVTVLNSLTPGVIGANQTICYNSTPAALTNVTSPAGADGNFIFQYQVSDDAANWVNIPGETNESLVLPSLTTNKFYRRAVSSMGATVYSNVVKITVSNFVTAPLVSVMPYYCKYSDVSLNVTPPLQYSYKWFDSNEAIIAQASTVSLLNLTSDVSLSVKAFLANGCASDPLNIVVKVDPIKANFTFDASEVTVGNPVHFTSTSTNASSFLWNFYDGDLISEQNPVHYYNVVGDTITKFSVILKVTSQQNCKDSLKVLNAISVYPLNSGINENNLGDITVFPNPTQGDITVTASQSLSAIYIYSAIGTLYKTIQSPDQSSRISISELMPGVYFLRLLTGSGKVVTVKLIKE